MTTKVSDTPADPVQSAVGIDYLARDYASFRRLMIDRLNAAAPGAVTGQPADPGTALVELLAHAADRLSYTQDAVATEAYLGTARMRTSVRRHARLLDYPMHDGCNARAWVAIQVTASANGQVLPRGTAILTRVEGMLPILGAADITPARAAGSEVFETLHDLPLVYAHNRILPFATAAAATLPVGATSAVLQNDELALALRVGDVLILEELAAESGGGDPTRRHAVRLTAVELGMDASGTRHVATISWGSADALPFALAVSRTALSGNIVLADHGYTLPEPERVSLPTRRRDRLVLGSGPLTWQTMVILSGRPQTYDPNAAASAARSAEFDPSGMISPAIVLAASTDPAGRVWTARRDLLGSGPHASDFVIEVDDEGQTGLRFGDGVYGKYPQDETLWASYRIGNGSLGNVGAEALYHIVSAITGIVRARNPLAACGGTNPESIEQVRLHAPYHFHKQLRAVTTDDYRAVLQDFPEVRDAQVIRRYTGSFYTTIITVQRVGSLPVDTAFKVRLRAFLDRYRMVGNDLQIAAAVEVPIDIKLVVEVLTGHSRSAVLEALKAAFSRGVRNGQNGFFHPDRCTLGQALYLSQIINVAMQQKGVSWVEAERFHRYTDSRALCIAVIKLRPNEVLLVANDDAAPERGRLEFSIGGGL